MDVSSASGMMQVCDAALAPVGYHRAPVVVNFRGMSLYRRCAYLA